MNFCVNCVVQVGQAISAANASASKHERDEENRVSSLEAQAESASEDWVMETSHRCKGLIVALNDRPKLHFRRRKNAMRKRRNVW